MRLSTIHTIADAFQAAINVNYYLHPIMLYHCRYSQGPAQAYTTTTVPPRPSRTIPLT